MPKNFFTISKNQVAALSTLVVLIILASSYFFIYLPANEKTLQAQRFRALQNTDRNIHAKIENSIGLLNNLLNSYQNGNAENRVALNKYIDGYSKINFTLLKPDSIKSKIWAERKDVLDGGYSITVNNSSKQITLLLARQQVKENDSTSFRMGMTFSFEQFISNLLPENIFDEYIVFSDNKPVYESFPSGISFMIKDSLFNEKMGISSPLVINHNISGTEYKMFMQSVSLAAGSEWIIGGLLTTERYRHEKTQLPTTMVLLLVTLLFITVVTFPWIKLYQMGSKDRLTITDGILSIFISMLLMSFLFFILFKYNLPFRSGVTKDSKEILANSISRAFSEEVKLAYTKIAYFDSLIKTEPSLQNNDITGLGKKSFNNSEKEKIINDTLKNKISSACKGISINQAFWLNHSGDEIVNWTAQKANAPHGNYVNRDYFKKIISDKTYYLNHDASKKYYADQVTSWTSGTFTSVVSISSRLSDDTNKIVAALSVNFKSLDAAILPTGFLFAIIDKQGKVLYHSEKSRNLNENLLNEFSANRDLLSCILAKTTGGFSTNYFGKKYDVLVKPMTALPYFLIIFGDTTFNETKDAEIYSFTISMLLLFFGFLVLQLLIIFLVSARQSFFKNQRFDTSWIGPKISCEKEYVISAVFNIITIIAMFSTFTYCTFLQYFFIILFSVTIMPFFLNGIFALRYQHEKRNILQYKTIALWWLGVIIILINVVAAALLSFSHFISILLYQLLIMALAATVYFFNENIYKAGRTFISRLRIGRKWNYINSFTFMGLTRLIATSGIPIVFFYFSSYNYEQNLSSRYKHIDFLNKLSDKIPAAAMDTYFTNNLYPPGVYIDSNWITNIAVINDSTFQKKYVFSYTKEHLNTIRYLKLFHIDVTDMAIAEGNFYNPHAADSSFFFNHLLDDACISGNGTISCVQPAQTGKFLQVKSADLIYQFPSIFTFNIKYFLKGILFWGILLTTLAGFYFLLCSIIKKLFALNLPDLSIWKELDKKILCDGNLNQLVFVIGLPGAGKKCQLLDKIKNGEIKDETQNKNFVYNEGDETNNNVLIADLLLIPDSSSDIAATERWENYLEKVFDKKNRLIIVNHFEYNIQDPVTNRVKLNFLERLMLENNSKIIILSTIHPVAFLDSEISQFLKKENTTTEAMPGADLERWHVLLGHYRIVLLPLEPILPAAKTGNDESVIRGQVFNMKDIPLSNARVLVKNTNTATVTDTNGNFNLVTQYQLPYTLKIKTVGYITEEIIIKSSVEIVTIKLEEAYYNWKERIRAETNYTHFLNKLQLPAIEVTKPLNLRERMAKCDELAFKLQVTSHYFYMYIWQSLTKEEKFLLYDMAEDNLVNSYDSYNLCILIGKGVIIPTDGSLKLFNKGFRNFILTAIGNTEAIKIKNQIKDNGNWNKLKNPLLMVILALLAFLLTSQEESYSKVITYLAALGAGVPTVLKIFSMFENQHPKTS